MRDTELKSELMIAHHERADALAVAIIIMARMVTIIRIDLKFIFHC